MRLTLSIPLMILGKNSPSFLGLGMQTPTVSWGLLLNAQNFRTLALHPWLSIPGIFAIVTCSPSTSSAPACATPLTRTTSRWRSWGQDGY